MALEWIPVAAVVFAGAVAEAPVPEAAVSDAVPEAEASVPAVAAEVPEPAEAPAGWEALDMSMPREMLASSTAMRPPERNPWACLPTAL